MPAEPSDGLLPSASFAGTGKMIAMQRCTEHSIKANRIEVPEHLKRLQESSNTRENDVLLLINFENCTIYTKFVSIENFEP